MRSIEEINADLDEMVLHEDLAGLRRIANECRVEESMLFVAASELATGIADSIEGRLTDAEEHYRRSIDHFTTAGDRNGIARAYLNLGLDSMLLGDYATALELSNRALAIYRDLGNAWGEARTLGNIGRAYAETGDYPAALEHFYRSYSIHESIGQIVEMNTQLLNVAVIYVTSGDLQEAERRCEECLVYFESSGHKPGLMRTYLNLGDIAYRQQQYDKAESYFRKGLALSEETGDQESKSESIAAMLRLYVDMERYDEIESLTKPSVRAQLSSPAHLASYLRALSLWKQTEGDLEGARAVLDDALETSRRTGIRQSEYDIHTELRDLALKMKDFESYVAHNTAAQEIFQEIQGRQAVQKIAVLEAERRMSKEREDRERERALLYGALPESIATRMLAGQDVSGDHFENASVLFMDIAGFTSISDRVPAGHVVHLLKAIFKVCDDVCRKHGLTKVKTIGDSYLAVAGVPEPLTDHAEHAARAAMDMLAELNALELRMDPELGDTSWTKDVGEVCVRIGIHCGPLVAGIVGEERLQYDVWGDTVNVASRMESTGEPGRIQVSYAFAEALGFESTDITLTSRGEIEVKGKGTMKTYWLS